MYKYFNLLAAGILGSSLLFLAVIGQAQTQDRSKEETLTQRLARRTALSEQNVQRLMAALGPAIREELEKGRQVNLPGLGAFRVVRVQQHRDMVEGGRPVIVPATNTIEFLATGEAITSANGAEAVPADTVPPFQYIVLPGQTPGQKAPRTHVPSSRVR
jgi:nucleoid DNA-binding protein